MKTMLYVLLILATSSAAVAEVPGLYSFRKPRTFDCETARSVRSDLYAMERMSFMPGNERFERVKAYLTETYLTARSIKNPAESQAYLKTMAECLKSASPVPPAAPKCQTVPNLVPKVPIPTANETEEKEAGSLTDELVELACVGTAAEAIFKYGLSAAAKSTLVLKAGGAKAALAGGGYATLAVSLAFIGGYFGGVTINRVDAMTGNHVARARDATVTKWVFQPIVNLIYGFPSERDLLRGEAEMLASMFLKDFAISRFPLNQPACVP